MGFYEELSRYYDHVFPFNHQTYNFLKSQFKNQGKLLDIATGTGSYATALAEDQYQVTAIDLDPKMIEAVKGKARANNLDIRLKVLNMLDLKTLKAETFDGVFCIGNSLVHLQNLEDIQKALKEVYGLLNKDGKLVIQIVNYDRVLQEDVKELPLIDRPNIPLKFIRKYDLIDGMIHFKTRLEVNHKETYHNRITLYPLTSQQLVEALSHIGFKKIECYGGFDGRPFDIESFPLIVTAIK